MSIPSQDDVAYQLQLHFNVELSPLPGKKIFYAGLLSNQKSLIVCSPQSKLYSDNRAWVDITEKQLAILEKADHSVIAFRIEGGTIYYVDFHLLHSHLTENTKVFNEREGNHWKLHLWPTYLVVQGSDLQFKLIPNKLSSLINSLEDSSENER